MKYEYQCDFIDAQGKSHHVDASLTQLKERESLGRVELKIDDNTLLIPRNPITGYMYGIDNITIMHIERMYGIFEKDYHNITNQSLKEYDDDLNLIFDYSGYL